MRLLWFTWKDLKNPLAGGAEVVNEELARRLAAAGHDVTLLVGGFKGAPAAETVNGYRIIRVGNRLTVYWAAWRYYRRHLKGRFDLVIDEINTMPFFAKFYADEPNLLFVHMLCREIWFYQLPKPLGLVGYLLEPLYLRLLSDRRVITISASTTTDLRRHGFKPDRMTVISEGIELTPVADVQAIAKYPAPTLLSLGSLRAMKRTLHQVKAFELAKRFLPNLKLKVAGDASDPYGQKVLNYIAKSPYRQDIEYLGRVSPEQKAELMQRSHLILVTSVKEGWGLIVTEAASQGTPAAVYDVDGLRDSVERGVTGLIAAQPTPAALGAAVVGVLQDPAAYAQMRAAAHRHSQTVTFEQAYQDFLAVVKQNLPT